MRLTKDVYSKVRAEAASATPDSDDPDDSAEQWRDWREWVNRAFGGELTPRQLDRLADYAMRHLPQ
jgi:hypothetical protein